MKVAIHQPHYLPWLGYLAKWAAADVFIFLDTVQYEKNGWQNRNRIKTRRGPAWLTVPVHAPFGTRLDAVTIDTRQPWRRRHLAALEHAYAGAPAFDRYRAELATLWQTEWSHLAPLNVTSARWLAQAFGITTPSYLASEMDVTDTDPAGRLVGLCRAVGGDTYLAGRDGVVYMDLDRFRQAGIGIRVQRYTHPVYPQPHGDFAPFLSGVDLLLTHGDQGRRILEQGDAWSDNLSGD